MSYLATIRQSLVNHWLMSIVVTVGFMILYYVVLLLATMIRFGEIPNYVVFHDFLHVYGLIFSSTPSWTDSFMILMDEPWLETGYKNPLYYGIATWSYMLIPPKMLLIAFVGFLLAVFFAVNAHARRVCANGKGKGVYLTAGIGSALVGLTSATLTWVVCCATPSWVVALAMLGVSSSLALLLEPLGSGITLLGVGLLIGAIVMRLRKIVRQSDSQSPLQPALKLQEA